MTGAFSLKFKNSPSSSVFSVCSVVKITRVLLREARIGDLRIAVSFQFVALRFETEVLRHLRGDVFGFGFVERNLLLEVCISIGQLRGDIELSADVDHQLLGAGQLAVVEREVARGFGHFDQL